MTATSKDEKKAVLMAAIGALGRYQLREFHNHFAVERAHKKVEETARAFTDAEYALAEADAAFAAARLRKLNSDRDRSQLRNLRHDRAMACETARQELWSTAFASSEAEILEVVENFGLETRIDWQLAKERELAEAEGAEAAAALTQASEARKVAVQARGRAKAAAEDASAALHKLPPNHPLGLKLMDLMSAVGDAAHDYLGTSQMQFAASYWNSQDLPFWKKLQDGSLSGMTLFEQTE